MTPRSPLESLVRKEWAERGPLLKAELGLFLLYLGYCVAYELEYRTRALVASHYTACLLFATLGAVLLAMPTAHGERTRGTLAFSSALPVSPRRLAWVRLLGAWVCLVVPILAGGLVMTALVASGWFEQAGLRGDYAEGLPTRPSLPRGAAVAFLWTTVAIAVAGAIQLVTLLSCVGTYCRTEGQVGFWGAVVALLWFAAAPVVWTLSLGGAEDWLGVLAPPALAANWGYLDVDGSSYTDLELAPLVGPNLVGSLAVTAFFGWVFARRYGAVLPETSASRREGRRPSPRWLRFPAVRPPGATGSLVWLDLRQSVPLALAGLMMAVLLTAASSLERPWSPGDLPKLAGELPANSWYVATLWSALVGAGIYAAELRPGLQQFWRSRPIDPSRWFWIKFLLGLAVVLTVLDGLPAAVAWGREGFDGRRHVGWAYVACLPLLHAQLYAVAVAAVCWLRRPLLAAVLSLTAFAWLELIVTSIPSRGGRGILDVFNSLDEAERSGSLSLSAHGYPVIYGGVLAVTLAAAFAARRAALKLSP